MGSKEAADELILDEARGANVFVISNDRFADFPDKQAVREDRIIRHEIVGDRVIVRDLKIDVEFNREKS